MVWAQLPAPVGRRPVVVLTRDAAIHQLNGITVAPVSQTIRGVITEVVLEPADGVSTTCVVQLDSIFTAQKANLHQVVTVLDPARMREIFDAIRAAFEMP